MKIKASEKLKGFNGKPIPYEPNNDYTVGMALANILANAKTGGKMKLFILGQKLYEGKDVEVDEADLTLIKQAVEQTEVHNNLVNGQLLVALSKLTESKK